MVIMEYTPEALKDLKYVVLTIKLKDSTNLDTKGYFVGIRSIVDKDFEVAKTEDLYVWVYRKGSVHMFHLGYYFIDELVIGFGDKGLSSSTQGFNDEEKDQKNAVDRLRKLALALRENGAGKANGLIDYEKYDDVPKAIKEDVEVGEVKSTTNNRSGGVNYSGGQRSPLYGGHGAAGYGYGGYTGTTHKSYVRKEVSTFNFKRTTRYNVPEAIEAMNAKVQEIREEIYEAPKLKRIPADSMKAKEAAADDDDDDYGYNYMCN